VQFLSGYKRRFDVDIDPETEAVVTIGSKEGLSHLLLAAIQPGDVVLTPSPAYPIHPYGAIIAGGDIRTFNICPCTDFFYELEQVYKTHGPDQKF